MSDDTLGKDRFQKIILSILSYKANGTRQQLYETRGGGGQYQYYCVLVLVLVGTVIRGISC